MIVPRNHLVIFAGLILASAARLSAVEFYVSPDGDDAAAGKRETPFRSLAAAAEAVLDHKPGPGKEAITVWIRGGRYPVRGTLSFDARFAGTREHPIRFRAIAGGEPIFDSGLGLDPTAARVVDDAAWLERLAPRARGGVLSMVVVSPVAREALLASSVRCSLDGQMMTIARYPNVGYAHIDRILDGGAVYAARRTPGAPPKWSLDQPIGGSFTVLGKDLAGWEREYDRIQKARVTGYLSYDWHRESHPVAAIDDGAARLAGYSRYGVIQKEKIPRRLMASNLLCELDAPGEFYFDDSENRLFFIPPAPLKSGSRLSIWGGPGLARFHGASFVSFEGVVIEGVGTGPAVVSIEGGEHILLAGCTLRNSSRPAVVISGGHNNGLQSCDIYDVPHHLSLGGGNVRELVAARNFAINCQFTQVSAADFHGGIRVTGVGNVFRNNLAHNFPGQAMTLGDCDHRIELNEFFQIGFEEGDGGAIYSAAAPWSWGNELRHNFLHHLMCLPQAHPRGGIYPDDGDQGETIERNVFYKAAHRAVLINGGAGHKVRENLFLEGYIGIYNTEANAERRFRDIARYNSGELKRGDKGDAIWRAEQVVGPNGWNQKPWASRFPLFREIMNQERMRFYPIECDFSGNRFSGNWRNIEYRIGSGVADVKDIAKARFIRSGDNREISMDVFRNPVTLDFGYRSPPDSAGLPRIPFAQIGMTADTYRQQPPAKNLYRAAVRRHFAGRPSYDPLGVYDPMTINQTVYFNTGRLVLESGGMLHGAP